ncbi:hypothetical protein P0L94_07890 [Microbacter sp. GSS18]|nr:hypothetical protein P0L94_07890 [Microbacter sp. GSS18]
MTEPDYTDADVDGALAAELTTPTTRPTGRSITGGVDPTTRAGGDPMPGGRPVNWYTLDDDDAADAWGALRPWVEWFTTRYDISLMIVPDCWWKHPGLVDELAALHTAFVASFDDSDTGYGPIGWHERLALALPRLRNHYAGGCSNGHRPHRPRSWNTVTDEQEWDAWTTRSHAHPATRPAGDGPTRKDTP